MKLNGSVIMLDVIMLNVANNPFMLNVMKLSVVMLSVIMLNVVILNVANNPFMLSVIMLSVVAP